MLLYTPFRKTNHVPFKRIYCEYFVLQYYRNRIQSNGSCFYILIVASLRSCDTPGVDVLNIRLLWPIVQAVESVKMAVAQLQVPASTLLTSWKHMFNFNNFDNFIFMYKVVVMLNADFTIFDKFKTIKLLKFFV